MLECFCQLLRGSPSITGHFILEMERLHGIRQPSQNYPELAGRLPPHAAVMGRPNFKLVGLAIGNGLTDPETQVVALNTIISVYPSLPV